MKSEKRVLLLLAASAAVIILVTVLILFSGKKEEMPAGTKRPTEKPVGTTPAEMLSAGHSMLAMIKAVDTETSAITLYNLEEGGELTLSYGVAADIRTKYGNLTYAAALTFGEIVRVEYDEELALVRLRLSDEHWELHGVDEFSITETMLSVNGTNYRLTERTVAYAEGQRLALGEVKSIDRVNLWGLGSEILGIEVTKGHGSIKLVNCEEFAGAEVTIGEQKDTLDGETAYLVREGSYTVSVRGDDRAAAVEVTVARNEQLVIDLYEYGGAPVETAEVRFKISPFSAVLRIDGEVTEYYEQDLTLSYGEHEIVAELGGYATYKGILTVAKPYQTVQINLPERPAGEERETVTEDGDTSGGGTGDGETAGEGTGAETTDGEADSTAGGEETVERRYVPIGEAGGYTYDKEHSTFVLVPEGAVVLIDGISLGAAPVEFEKLLGTYTVTLRKDGREKEYTVTVEDDGEDVYWKFPLQ